MTVHRLVGNNHMICMSEGAQLYAEASGPGWLTTLRGVNPGSTVVLVFKNEYGLKENGDYDANLIGTYHSIRVDLPPAGASEAGEAKHPANPPEAAEMQPPTNPSEGDNVPPPDPNRE